MPLFAEYVSNLLGVLLSVLEIAILIRVLLSWFPIDRSNPIVSLVWQITEPVLAPIRRVLPRLGMIDLSPLAALLVLQFIAQAVHVPLAF